MSVELNNNATFKQAFKKRCFLFSLAILQIAAQLRKDRNNWILIDQLIRSATSVGANIVEGGNSTSKKECINYFQIALKSASETLYWLALLKETSADTKELTRLIKECLEIKKLLSTIILNTKDNSRF
jgi:four helix bundle protein